MGIKSNIVLGVISAIVFGIGVFFFVLVVPAFSLYCPTDSINSVPGRTSIPVMTPALLPDGYSFQRALVKPNEITLRYFDGPTCGKDASDGVLEVTGEKMSPTFNMTATQYVDNHYETLKHQYYMKEHYDFSDNRHAYGISYAITEKREYSITVGDDDTNTLYNVRANMDPHRLAAIAESLYEVK